MKELNNSIKFIWKYAKNSKFKVLLYLLFNIFRVIMDVAFPILSANLIISITSNQINQLFFIALIIYILNIINKLLDFISGKISDEIYYSLTINIQSSLSNEILKIENKVLDTNSSGVFISRLTRDCENLSDVFNTLIEFSESILSNVGVLLAVFIINKIIFIYFIFVIILMYLLNKKRIIIRNENNKKHKEKYEKLTGFIGELVRGARDIKMLNSEISFKDEMYKRIEDNNKIAYKRDLTNRKFLLSIRSIKDTFDFILIIMFIVLFNNNLLTLTSAIIIYNYSGKITELINLINNFTQSLKDFNLSTSRIVEIIDSDKFTKEEFGNIHLSNIDGNFEFKDVTFRYNDEGQKILKNISFKVNANETVAFVGKTGSGKTTIFNLLCKMYKINNGLITIDGVDINKLDKDTIRQNITVISQNPYIFNVSIKDNFKLVKKDVTLKEIKEACKLACLDKFIENLPNKYDTLIGEGGVNLSGGEKQRLAIARALIQKTEIILFDEATSALDNETQFQIQKAIENMKREYTIMIIAHRLSTIKNVDRILFINNGKIECEGTHEYLLKNCDEYKELYESEMQKD